MNRIIKLYPNSAILICIHLKTQMSKYSVFDLYALIKQYNFISILYLNLQIMRSNNGSLWHKRELAEHHYEEDQTNE